jgi:hypothetical protein
MKTKNSLLICLFAFLLLSVPSFASPTDPSLPRAGSSDYNAESEKLIKRLEEIKSMDTKNMTRKEKRALRKEVKSIEKRVISNGGIYISIGALLIVILLLILLL